ncbi:MAG: M20/M25/M40 family metallo-hydrolase [Gemmatimonadales bacterium]
MAALPGTGRAQAIRAADTAALMHTVRVLAADSMEGRRAGTAGSARARGWLLTRLRAIGADSIGAGFERRFPLGRAGEGVNLVAVIRGRSRADGSIVLSAHYDHVGVRNGQIYNGADDNASGVAALLAVAEAVRRRPLEHTLVLALFDAEESGLLGAKAFVDAPPVPRTGVLLNVNLDMVGHSASGELFVAGTARQPRFRPVLDSLVSRAPVKLRFGHDRAGVPGEKDWTFDSDHGAFFSVGVPFLYFGVEDHEDYHRPTDDPGTLTPAFFGGAVGTIEAALRAVDAMLAAQR